MRRRNRFSTVKIPSNLVDKLIAAHILATHQNPDGAYADSPFSAQDISTYIRFSKTIKPQVWVLYTPAHTGR